jgi:hypothetical protein
MLFCMHSGGNTIGYGLTSLQLNVENGSITSSHQGLRLETVHIPSSFVIFLSSFR